MNIALDIGLALLMITFAMLWGLAALDGQILARRLNQEERAAARARSRHETLAMSLANLGRS